MSAGDGAPDALAAPARGRTYGVERLAALSDGVFAIVLTLLVLELKIPEVPTGAEQELVADLLGQIPSLVAWVVSFILVARFWLVHHAVLESIEQCHLGTMVSNFAVLGCVSLVPFGAALIGTYEWDLVAIALFSAVMALSGLSLGLFARHVARHPHLHKTEGATNLRWHWRYHALAIPAFATFAILVALVHHPGTALSAWILEPLIALGLAVRSG